jgi:hypothetical protein
MKNQYFGDNRDLFKYDLIWQIAHAGLVDHFTFIPMLTEPDNTEEGNQRKAKAGIRNLTLKSFLDRCVEDGRRNIKELESFFKDLLTIYRKDDKDKYFSNGQRKEYFEVPDELLKIKKSLILVDPDKGLQGEKSHKSDKEHILYSEVKTLYDRMDRSSILMIFQYRPRMEKWRNCCQRISDELTKKVGNLPIHITSDPVIFFFLTKDNNSLRESLGKVISKYGEAYNLKVEVT